MPFKSNGIKQPATWSKAFGWVLLLVPLIGASNATGWTVALSVLG